MPVSALLRVCRLALALGMTSIAPLLGWAQPALPPCPERPTVIRGELYTDSRRWCPEHVVRDPGLEPLSFTALAAAPDGALYATRPISGAVMAIRDSDGDALPDEMRVFAEGLTQPNGLAYHNGALYVAGGPHIYRISAAGEVTTLVDDLPTGSGFPVAGLAIGADERLYAALGAPCSNCEFADAERGAILSMDLDGSGRQVFASGFRNPADVAWYRGRLWTLDSAPPQSQRNALDELNRLEAGGWYGFPTCLGADAPNLEGSCGEGIAPAMRFGTGAVPTSLAAYEHDWLPGVEDSLIVVLRGEPSQVDFVGYKVIMITFDDDDKPLGSTLILPYTYESGRQAYIPYRGQALFWEQFIHLNERGFGIYPQQPLAVAVSPEGWLYISITGGRIIALRPRLKERDHRRLYPIWTPMNPDYDPSVAPPDYAY